MSNVKHTQRIIWYAMFAVAGIIAVAFGVLGYTDSYVAGLGGASIGVAGIKLSKELRYAKDPAYAKRVDAVDSDERLAFLASKSAEITFQLSIVALAVLSLALRPLGYDDTASVLCVVMGVETAMYWVSYLVVSRRY